MDWQMWFKITTVFKSDATLGDWVSAAVNLLEMGFQWDCSQVLARGGSPRCPCGWLCDNLLPQKQILVLFTEIFYSKLCCWCFRFPKDYWENFTEASEAVFGRQELFTSFIMWARDINQPDKYSLWAKVRASGGGKTNRVHNAMEDFTAQSY